MLSVVGLIFIYNIEKIYVCETCNLRMQKDQYSSVKGQGIYQSLTILISRDTHGN